MRVTIDIPDDLAEQLRPVYGPNLNRAVIERFALDGYRAGTITRYQLQRLLGFDGRLETEDWLGRMGEHETYTLDDLEEDGCTLRELFPG